jgi:hypothetical protein
MEPLQTLALEGSSVSISVTARKLILAACDSDLQILVILRRRIRFE